MIIYLNIKTYLKYQRYKGTTSVWVYEDKANYKEDDVIDFIVNNI